MLPRPRAVVALAGAALLALGLTLPAQAGAARQSATRTAASSNVVTVTSALDGPRGLAVINKHKSFVGQADGSVVRVVKHAGMPATVTTVTHVPATFIAPALARGRHHTLWILTAGGEPGTAGLATLYKWRPGWTAAKAFADIGAYQQHDPDPFDLESNPTDTDPYGVVALRHGVLVSDAAGNDLLRVNGHGVIHTVARLKPRTVEVPAGLPNDPEAPGPNPPAGSMIPSEAVATSVTVGSDGFWYVGELRGFPATPGTSEIWRIKPGTRNAVCDPAHPRAGHCKRFLDGLTSIVDLAPAPNGRLYALEISKASWLIMEAQLGSGGPVTPGALFKVRKHHVIRELGKGKFLEAGQVDRRRRVLEVTAPVFGPGNLFRVR